MRFNVLNALGAAIVILLLIPNVLSAFRNRGEKNRCTNTGPGILEQVGRYGCLVLMWLPFPVGKFGFSSVFGLLLYLGGNGLLLSAYWVVHILCFSRRNKAGGVTLAALPACSFLLSGLLLRHWLLAGFAVLFAAVHLDMAVKNAEACGPAE